VLAYLCFLLASRAISRADLARFASVVRTVLTPPRKGRTALAGSLASLPPPQIDALAAVAHPSGPGAPPVSPSSLVGGLRALTARGTATDCDDAIGRYLMSRLSRAERDALARGLWSQGVRPADLDRLETTLDQLKQLPGSAWPDPDPDLTRAVAGSG